MFGGAGGWDALNQVSARQVAAARSLGATSWRAFWRVEWPAIAPWLASSLGLVFLYCFAGFGLALVLGGQRYATVEVEIYSLVAHELKLAEASVLALWMILLTGGVALAYAALEKRLAAPMRTDPLPRQRPTGVLQWLALTGGLAVLVFFRVAPMLAIVWRAGSEKRGRRCWTKKRGVLCGTLCASPSWLWCWPRCWAWPMRWWPRVLWRGAASSPFVVSVCHGSLRLVIAVPAMDG